MVLNFEIKNISRSTLKVSEEDSQNNKVKIKKIRF
jgi:hypothetical protein